MDPIEQKPRRLYPNADRNLNENTGASTSENFSNTQQNNSSIDQPAARPLVHLSDVLQPGKTDINNDHRTSSVHTFKDDMANAASKGGFSIGKIMEANSRKKHQTTDNTVDVGKESKNILIKITIFIVCILIIGVFSYIGFKSAKTPEQIALQRNPSQQITGNILYSEISVPMTMEGKNRSLLFREISQESSSNISPGKIKSLIFVYNSTSSVSILSSEFLNIVAPSAPDILVRNLKDEYVFGYYSHESNEPFIILKSSNYDSTFAGMLDWETSMYADLGDLIYKKDIKSIPTEQSTTSAITILFSATSSTSSVATSSTPKTTLTQEPSTKKDIVLSEYDTEFVDRVISNNDARVLYRPNGEIAFFYTFFNKDIIIIATSEQTLKEIIYRLTSGKITR
jgi:hypothetical protein